MTLTRWTCDEVAGVPGFAAWVAIELLGEPKPGSNVFISAASGAVGMHAGQLAKLRGCRVIGSAGSDEKVVTILCFQLPNMRIDNLKSRPTAFVSYI